jgi:hypothetical protein
MALFLEQEQCADIKIADKNTEFIEEFSSHAISTVLIFHNEIHPSF